MAIHWIENVVFARAVNEKGLEEDLKLDLYLPPRDRSRLRPGVLLFHGGGFALGNDKRQGYILALARALAERGYVCASFDYRIRANPAQDWPGTLRDAVRDARAALDWARSNLGVYRADSENLVLLGGSAGAVLINNLVHNPRQPVTTPADGVRGIVNLWGSPPPQMRSFATVNAACPPNLVVHGTADELVPYALSEQLVAELHAAGVQAALLSLPGAAHTAILQQPELVTGTIVGVLKQVTSRPKV